MVVNGASWVLVSCTLIVAIFPVPVAIAALCVALVSDAAAALIGRRWGSLKTGLGDKSLQGSTAFLLTGLGVALLVPGLNNTAAVIGVLAGTVLEAVPLPLNDNVVVPLGIAVAITATLALQGAL
jgi:dolichol kinase